MIRKILKTLNSSLGEVFNRLKYYTRIILKTFGLALYSDYKAERDRAESSTSQKLAAREYIDRQKSEGNGVVYLSEDEQKVFGYILFNSKDDTADIEQRIENAEEFVESYSE